METRDARLRRMRMRSMRRGSREMDLILQAFAAARLEGMTQAELDAYDALLSENDHDLYGWITGQAPVPGDLASLIAAIREVTRTLGRDSQPVE